MRNPFGTFVEAEPERRDAVRTEAVVWDKGARAVWKLKGGNDRSSVVLQGMYFLLKTADNSVVGTLCLNRYRQWT